MSETVLQQLLERQLLDVGDDDAKYQRLQRAAETLRKRLAADPTLAIAFALAAADPSTPSDDRAFTEADEALKGTWATYRNKWPDAPTQIWRAILLAALDERGKEVPEIAAAVALTLVSILSRIEPSRDGDVLLAVYRRLRSSAEAHAAAAWSDAVPERRLRVAKPKPAAKLAATPIKVDLATQTKLWGAAAGPHDAQNQPYDAPNPNFPNSAVEWSHEFVPRAGKAVAGAVEAAVKSLADLSTAWADAQQTQMSQWATATGDALRDTASEVLHGSRGVQRRSALLWWRAAMASPSSGRSYRDSSVLVAAVQMAIDLHKQIPEHAPESVEHFLRETVRDLVRTVSSDSQQSGDSQATVTSTSSVGDAVDEIASAVVGLPTGSAATTFVAGSRATLLQVLLAATSTSRPQELLTYLGPVAIGPVTADELAAWVFRDLQAHRLVVESAKAASEKSEQSAAT